MGIDNYFHYETYKHELANGYTCCEMSWVLDKKYSDEQGVRKDWQHEVQDVPPL